MRLPNATPRVADGACLRLRQARRRPTGERPGAGRSRGGHAATSAKVNPVPIKTSVGQRLDRAPLGPVIWQDTFDGAEKLDLWDAKANPAGTWKDSYRWGWGYAGEGDRILNDELECYTARAAGIANNVLSLTASALAPADQKACFGKAYQSALLTTEKSHSFTKLYAELYSAASPTLTAGTWPAWWFLYGNGAYEIDGLEVLGHQPTIAHMTIHGPLTQPQGYGAQFNVRDLRSNWVRFGVLRDGRFIVWYVDDVEVQRVLDPRPDLPVYMLLNLALGGWATQGGVKLGPMPSTWNIERVSVYAWKG